MKLIHILGIGIPLIIIFFISIVGIFDFGVSVEANSPEVVILGNNPQVIRTIKITNDFILTKREQIDYVLCQNSSQSYNYPISYKVYVDGLKSNYSEYVDIKPKESKTIELIVEDFTSSYRSINFKDTEELVLFETNSKENNYNSGLCPTLLEDEEGISIKLDKSNYVAPSSNSQVSPSTCNDSDGEDYYTRGVAIVKKSSGDIINHPDYCTNDLLTEWICSGSVASSKTNLQCTNGCSDGACIKKQIEDKPGYIYAIGKSSLEGCYRSLNDLNNSKYIKGSVIYDDGRTEHDSCTDSGTVLEVKCFEAESGYTYYSPTEYWCDPGDSCKEGVCAKS